VRIRRLFERSGFDDLVILDELCSGTNPSEGEEIAQLVISLLYRLSPQAFITTHFLEFAARLAKHPPVPGLEFLQVELDERLRPLYQFVPAWRRPRSRRRPPSGLASRGKPWRP